MLASQQKWLVSSTSSSLVRRNNVFALHRKIVSLELAHPHNISPALINDPGSVGNHGEEKQDGPRPRRQSLSHLRWHLSPLAVSVHLRHRAAKQPDEAIQDELLEF